MRDAEERKLEAVLGSEISVEAAAVLRSRGVLAKLMDWGVVAATAPLALKGLASFQLTAKKPNGPGLDEVDALALKSLPFRN
jgi:hypothetical protein